jgi:hypothetical protein
LAQRLLVGQKILQVPLLFKNVPLFEKIEATFEKIEATFEKQVATLPQRPFKAYHSH